ncbi:MAG: RluA family pseudouridine synthase [Chloroflexota bacterium]
MGERLVVLLFEEEGSQRLDKFLVASLPEYSRSQLQGLIKGGRVEVNGELTMKSGFKLERLAQVRVHLPPTETDKVLPEYLPLDVLFEDEDVLVVDKPAGMVVHPATGHKAGTLVHAVLAHAPEVRGVGEADRWGVVHRLDKDTSGVIIVAKNDSTRRWLQKQFRNHLVEKTYLALVDGAPPTPAGRVEAPILRDTAQRKRMQVVPMGRGREAFSEYRVLETFREHTLLEVHPITGRTHQVRVHLAFLGCPVVGDTVYGKRKPSLSLGRHFLHAARLKVTLPGGERLFEAPLPRELEEALQHLRGGVL